MATKYDDATRAQKEKAEKDYWLSKGFKPLLDPNLRGYFMAGADGTLVSVGRFAVVTCRNHTRAWRWKPATHPLRGSISNSGYQVVALYLDGIGKHVNVHRVVYEAFHGPIPKGKQIDHIDGKKLNNELLNLQLVSHTGNLRKAVKQKGQWRSWTRGSNKAKLTSTQVTEVLSKYNNGSSIKELKQEYKVSATTIYKIVNGDHWKEIYREFKNEQEQIAACG